MMGFLIRIPGSSNLPHRDIHRYSMMGWMLNKKISRNHLNGKELSE